MTFLFLLSALVACNSGTETLTGTDFNPEDEAAEATVEVVPSAARIPVGETLRFKAQVVDEDGNAVDGAEVTWSSSDPDVATVDAQGVAEGLADGKVEVTASVESGSGGRAELAVQARNESTGPPVASIEVAPSEAEVSVGSTVQFDATVLGEDGNEMDGVEVAWSSSDPVIATVDGSGLAEGVASGSVQISATADNGVGGEASLTVAVEEEASPEPAAIEVTPSDAEVSVGSTVQFDATVLSEDGNEIDGVEVAWSSSDPAIATVDGSGLAEGVASGSVQISATADNGVGGEASLTVAVEEEASPEPAAIEVTPSDAEISVGSTVQFDATVLGEDGNEMDGVEVAWSSSDPAIATVDGSGLAEGVASGSVQISATADNGVGGEATLAIVGATSSPVEVEEPELPRAEVAVQLPSVDRTVRVASEAELEAAFDDVRPGDEIVLSRDRVWGQITLPDHGGDWAILRGEGDLPPAGTRITPDHDVTRVQHGSNGGIINASDVEGWYVYGLKAETTGDITDGLVVQNSSRIVFDRVWVWAPGDAGSLVIRRGMRLNGENVALVNSRVEGIIRSGQQSQGVGVWDGGGPFLIENNFIEALNQNFLAGGASPSSLDNNPSDGVIRRNHFYKRPAWSGQTGTIFMMEWKAGERWLVEGNVVENDYFNYSVAVKAPTEVQGVAGQRTGDLTFRKNRYIGDLEGAGGYTLNRKASRSHTVDAGTYLLEDEWWDPRSGRAIRLHHAPDHVTIRRVTIPSTHSSLELIGELDAGSEARLGIDGYRARAGSYGIWLASGSDDFQDYYPGHQVRDYWQYWGDDGRNQCYRNTGIPGTLDADQQGGLHCVEFESDIPGDVGVDKAAVDAMINGVRDGHLP